MRLLLLAACAALLALLVPSAARADTVRLDVSAAATKALTARGVTLTAVTPGRRTGRRIELPVSGPRAGGVALQGALRFRRGARAASVTSLELVNGTILSGRIAGASRTSVLVRGRLTLAAARRLSTRLKLRRTLTASSLGAMRVVASTAPGGTRTGTPGGSAGTGGGAGTTPGSTTPGTSTPGGNCSGFTSKPIAAAPAAPAPPAGAVTLTSATVEWHARDSWIRYVNAGEGTSTSGGAVSGPPTVRPGTSTPLVYDFGFTPDLTRSWFDPATQRFALLGGGAVRFAYTAHCIDLSTADPEIVYDGTAGSTVFRMFGAGVTDPGNTRGDFLALGAKAPTVVGTTRTYAQIPAQISEQGAAVLSDMYGPGNREFGWLTVTFTTP